MRTMNNKSSEVLKPENLAKIEKISHFEYNWNGNQGEKFTNEAICIFREIINSLMIQPKIVPTGRNTILMQYDRDDESRIVFEVGACKVEQIYIPHGEYRADVQTYTENIFERINIAVEKFYKNSNSISDGEQLC